jgi:hypothetical protein
MDVKKFFADLIAMYRKPTESPAPAPVVDVDAVPEAGQNARYEESADRRDTKMTMLRATRSTGKPKTRAAILKGTRSVTNRVTMRAFKLA